MLIPDSVIPRRRGSIRGERKPLSRRQAGYRQMRIVSGAWRVESDGETAGVVKVGFPWGMV